jgi:hypothetical protein
MSDDNIHHSPPVDGTEVPLRSVDGYVLEKTPADYFSVALFGGSGNNCFRPAGIINRGRLEWR